ncbi:family 16 glycoside hydrolase [Bifidobacterium avesanii]|uniref:family 16 glycoside hydrolase n=1 Tax=Bifidobacterium avesanii TaxID=1798157 RepID=UPI001386256D|nr:family 16 glycoside hydrolase [Bifidobacterium avesanii]KAB8294646.1 hypothetical protein DSM100685_0439 [Bifidobacterium avesanii]
MTIKTQETDKLADDQTKGVDPKAIQPKDGVRPAGDDQPTVDVLLAKRDVDKAAANRNGLTYKGFGVLSGNATSSLLMDYKAEHPDVYWKLVETLFGGDRPMMNTVKVEMGNDRNNSTGPNVATMRDRDEYPAVTREPGFQLAADARRYNPRLHVSILRWHAPTWVRTNDDVYRWYKNTILAAYREYGFMVDSVNPDVNERTADLDWVSEFSRRVKADETGFEGNGPDDPNAGFASERERELFHRIKTITSDEEVTGTFGDDMVGNAEYLRSIDVASYHYSVEDDPHGNFTRLADEFDKEVWNSEAQATFSCSADRPNNTNDDGTEAGAGVGAEAGTGTGADDAAKHYAGTGIGGQNGPLEMANTLVKGFVESRRTCALYQPAIGSFYENMEYSYKELISARDPWSGWMYYDAGCAVLEHFARFANLGWVGVDDEDGRRPIWRAIPAASGCEVGGNNPVNGARHGEPSYLTLAAPDGSDFSAVIVNDSAYEKHYRFAVDAALAAAGRPLTVWETRAAESGEPYDARWLAKRGVLQPARYAVRGGEDASAATQATHAPHATMESAFDAEPTVGGADGEARETVEYDITVAPWSMITATTLADNESAGSASDGTAVAVGESASRLPRAAEHTRAVLDQDPERGVLYADDFRYEDAPDVQVFKGDALVTEPYLASRGGDAGATPRYTTDTNGAFEVVPDPERGRVLRQQIDWPHAGNAWIEGDPRTAIGDMRWTNYRVSVDVRFEPYEGRAPYVLLGAREMAGGKFTTDICAYDVKLRADGVYLLRRFGDEKRRGHLEDLRKRAKAALARAFEPGADVWNTVSLEVAGDTVTFAVNGVDIASWRDEHPQSAGRINLGTSFNHVRFSNLRVERIPGFAPYYSELIDDLHTVSWDDTATPRLSYAGPWIHETGKGMYDYNRTTTTSLGAGASVSLTFDGVGLDVFGRSDGKARLTATVDGEPWNGDAEGNTSATLPVMPADGSLRCEFQLHGLTPGRHTVTLATATDHPFLIDAIGTLHE